MGVPEECAALAPELTWRYVVLERKELFKSVIECKVDGRGYHRCATDDFVENKVRDGRLRAIAHEGSTNTTGGHTEKPLVGASVLVGSALADLELLSTARAFVGSSESYFGRFVYFLLYGK